MHYQHSYHAGNFADVFKHVLLVALLRALCRKEKPWLYLDTHAGGGLYELPQDSTGRPREWRDGIGRLWGASPADPVLVRYLSLVTEANQDSATGLLSPQVYPGSPWLAAHLARTQDRVVACELIDAVSDRLAIALPGIERHRRDGYEAFSLLPPRESRGVMLVDPPFERTDELEAAAALIKKAHQRFQRGIFALWYPLKNRYAVSRCIMRISRTCGGSVMKAEMHRRGPADGYMHACGLAIVNPPYGFTEAAGPALRELASLFGGNTWAGITLV